MADGQAHSAPASSAGSVPTSQLQAEYAAHSALQVSGASAPTPGLKTETPSQPTTAVQVTKTLTTDQMAVGNTKFEFMLRHEGKLGVFYARANAAHEECILNMNVEDVRNGIYHTLRGVLHRLITSEKKVEPPNIEGVANATAGALTTGVMVMMYLKMRNVHLNYSTEGNLYYAKPKVPEKFEIPKPFAIAIQQLGAVIIDNLTNCKTAVPSAPEEELGRFLLPEGVLWNSIAYARAAEYATSLGMHFSSVDLSVKIGSTWWLYENDDENDFVTSRMIVPEVNYTETTALLHLMFCCDENGRVVSSVFQLGDLDQGDFGTMIRNPYLFINISAFFAYSDEPLKSYWKIQ